MAPPTDSDDQPGWLKGDLPTASAGDAPPATNAADSATGGVEASEIASAAEPESDEIEGDLLEAEASAEPPAVEPSSLAELVDASPEAEAAPGASVRAIEAETPAEAETAPPAPAEPLTIPAGEPLGLEALVEALLFVADGAAPVGQLAEALEVPLREVEAALASLAETYARRGIHLQRFRDRVQLTTSPGAAEAVERFLGLAAATPLSRAALETLAIIAYQQPVTRPQIEAVRGVNSDSVIKNLLSKGLVEETGRAEGPGRPVLYCTTSEFLQHFGLDSLGQLPPLKLAEAGTPLPTQDEILKG